jgi:enamine deaminase RidA (YjgF/YER057c/UK114 family)
MSIPYGHDMGDKTAEHLAYPPEMFTKMMIDTFNALCRESGDNGPSCRYRCTPTLRAFPIASMLSIEGSNIFAVTAMSGLRPAAKLSRISVHDGISQTPSRQCASRRHQRNEKQPMYRLINPPSVNVSPRYSASVEVHKPERWLFISGQVGRGTDGNIAAGIEAQADLAWRNVLACLAGAHMTIEDIVDTTVYLVGRDVNAGYDAVRNKYLGALRPASTKIYVSGLAHPDMLCEIQAVAAQ